MKLRNSEHYFDDISGFLYPIIGSQGVAELRRFFEELVVQCLFILCCLQVPDRWRLSVSADDLRNSISHELAHNSELLDVVMVVDGTSPVDPLPDDPRRPHLEVCVVGPKVLSAARQFAAHA